MSVTEPPMDEPEPAPDPEMEPLEPETPTKGPPTSDHIEGSAPESVNLVDHFSDTDAKKCADEVIRGFDRDWDSTTAWRERRDSQLKLYLGIMPPPPSGEMRTQVHYPIISVAVQRIKARIYDQQFPSNGEYFGAKPTDALDLERCVRIAKHMNWQIEHQIREYVPNHDVLITQCVLFGSAFSYMYWNSETDRPCHEACRTEDIVISYTEDCTDPEMSTVRRISRIIRKYRHELEALQDSGYYANVDEIYVPGQDNSNVGPGDSTLNEQDKPIRETVDRFAGTERPDDDPTLPRKLIEQHTWYKLPGEDRERAVVITVDYSKRCLLCVKIREDEDPEDRARFNREKDANEAQYASAMQTYDIDRQHYLAGMTLMSAMATQQPQDMTAPPMPGEMTSTPMPMPGEQSATMPGPMPPAPQPPTPPAEPAPVKMIPVNFFTHFVFDPNPEGFYGLGIGAMLEGHNIVADTIASQMVDAGTLSNCFTGIMSRQVKMSRGELKIKPGIINEVDLPPQDLKNAILPLIFKGPEPQLAQFIRDQKDEASELSGANEILSGEVGGSNETATTTQIRISQALAAISIMNKRYTRARTIEGRHLARLNSVHLGDEEYFTVVDPFKKVPPTATLDEKLAANPPQQISRMDYLQDVDITITADPRMASQPQRFQEALQAWNLVNSSPMFQTNPALMMAAAKNLFVAMDRPEMVAALMTPPPPPPPGPPPGAPGQPPQPGPGQGPPQPPNGAGAPRPKPQSPGPRVPNAGPTPENGPQMGQGQ